MSLSVSTEFVIQYAVADGWKDTTRPERTLPDAFVRVERYSNMYPDVPTRVVERTTTEAVIWEGEAV